MIILGISIAIVLPLKIRKLVLRYQETFTNTLKRFRIKHFFSEMVKSRLTLFSRKFNFAPDYNEL